MNVMEGELADAVNAIIKEGWDLRDGQVVPETDDITLGNSGVKLDATVLYADLADSTELAIFDREIAAEVYKLNHNNCRADFSRRLVRERKRKQNDGAAIIECRSRHREGCPISFRMWVLTKRQSQRPNPKNRPELVR